MSVNVCLNICHVHVHKMSLGPLWEWSYKWNVSLHKVAGNWIWFSERATSHLSSVLFILDVDFVFWYFAQIVYLIYGFCDGICQDSLNIG